jgi:ABC-type multidrug transport system permease subunit
MNIDRQLDRISYYIFYIPFNILALILAIPIVIVSLPYTYFRNYNEFCVLVSGYNILLVYFIIYRYIFDGLIELIN